MPSKGRTSTSARASTSAIAPSAGPPVMASASPAAVLATEPLAADTAVEPEAIPLLDEDPAPGTPEWAELYARAVACHREERDRIDREQAEAQRLWEDFLAAQGTAVPEGERSLADNDELHQQLLRLALTTGGTYERENVIGDPNQTFGIEIEFDGADPHAVARALYEAGLTTSPTQRGYHSAREGFEKSIRVGTAGQQPGVRAGYPGQRRCSPSSSTRWPGSWSSC